MVAPVLAMLKSPNSNNCYSLTDFDQTYQILWFIKLFIVKHILY